MKTIAITIEGKTPLLCNRYTDAAQIRTEEGNSRSTKGDPGTPLEIAESKLYKDPHGNIIIPQPNVFRCIIDAGKFHKTGKRQVTTQKTSLIPACLAIDEAYFPLQHKEPWTIDTRPVVNPTTGGRVICHRPCFHDWWLEFTAELDTEIIGLKLLRDIVDDAGKRIGLGDFRPDRKGPFGKFVVTRWAVEEPLELRKAA